MSRALAPFGSKHGKDESVQYIISDAQQHQAEAEEWQKANAEGKCSAVVAAAVRIAAEIIIEQA